MTFFPKLPANAPPWLRDLTKSTVDLFRRPMPAPFALKQYATADLPPAAEHGGAIVYDSTATCLKISTGSAWVAVSDADLAAIAALATTGILARTGTGTWATRTLTEPAAGLTITNPAGIAGNPTFALAGDLAGVEGLSTTGLAARTAASTWTTRTITGTANEITVADGGGVAANPTLSLPTSLTFTGKTVTGGTFTGMVSATIVNAQNASTGMRIDNSDSGTSASALFDFRQGALGTGDRLLVGVLGTGYTAVTGWQDAGLITAQANLSGGLILNANASAGVKVEVGGNGSASQVAVFTAAGLDVVGLLRCDTFRIDATPTAAAVTQTHHTPININGTVYKLLLAT